MPRSTESDCAPGYFVLMTALTKRWAAGGSGAVGRAAVWGRDPGSRGYRRRPRAGGRLSCGVAAPPARGEVGHLRRLATMRARMARGEAGSSRTALHGGPGV